MEQLHFDISNAIYFFLKRNKRNNKTNVNRLQNEYLFYANTFYIYTLMSRAQQTPIFMYYEILYLFL